MSDTDRRLASPEHRERVARLADYAFLRAGGDLTGAAAALETIAARACRSPEYRDAAILLRRRADTLTGV